MAGEDEDRKEVEEVSPGVLDDLEPLLTFIKESRGFDFTGYKRGSLTRRIRKRMGMVGAATFAEYRQLLDSRPEEFTELFNTILINVTGFFRDRDAWRYLAETTLPAILAGKDLDDPIRVWSAGVASGQEAYSLAVLLCDVLGEERFRHAVKLYATDLDEDALTTARHGVYPRKDVHAAFTEDQVNRYFEEDNSGLAFRKDLRRSLIFGRHDLVQDPPISRVDLLVCRNTLMYFVADTQRRILSSFHFALNASGYLFLGKSEALITRTDLFTTEDVRFHMFAKRPLNDRHRLRANTRPPTLPTPVQHAHNLLESALEASPLAQVIVDAEQKVVAVNRHARSLFGIGSEQVGQPFKDLQVSYRPVELRSVLDQVLRDWRAASVPDVEFEPSPGSV
ncbi:MAG TPA: CheR family methyltransferase, partial [Acidimicrobiales bacterium]|nr:CheR family methyltransferase [Acidimicrobiales bacterium]